MQDDPVTDLRSAVDMLAELDIELAGSAASDPYQAVVDTVVTRIAHADSASITLLRRDTFSTVSATDARARRADAIQYELQSGPCVDVILAEAHYQPADLRHDQRWPEFGRRVHADCGFISMLSYRLHTELADDDSIAGLNIYADRAEAFDAADAETGYLLATHAAMAIAAATNLDQVTNLRRALETSRQIGTAIGILMTRHRATPDQAFNLLRLASRRSNRKVHALAVDVIRAGELDLTDLQPRVPRTAHPDAAAPILRAATEI